MRECRAGDAQQFKDVRLGLLAPPDKIFSESYIPMCVGEIPVDRQRTLTLGDPLGSAVAVGAGEPAKSDDISDQDRRKLPGLAHCAVLGIETLYHNLGPKPPKYVAALRANQAIQGEQVMMRLTTAGLFLVAGVHLASAAEVATRGAAVNDYPTSARAEYVFACMKTNGETREALDQCSCSIDVIASLLPYDAYVAGETVASMNQASGQIGAEFRGAAIARDALARLRRAQAEAEVRCF
jgi:hypothetical protein